MRARADGRPIDEDRAACNEKNGGKKGSLIV